MEPQVSRGSFRDATVDAYQTDTKLLMARRIPMAAVLLVAASATVSGIDALYHPERTAGLLLGFAIFVIVSVVQIVVVRRRPALSVVVAGGVITYVALVLSIFCGVVQARTEVLLLSLALLMTGSAVLFPWGVRGQLGISIGALIAYPLALALGAIPTLPVAYEVFGLATAACVAGLGAYVLDQYRFSTFQHAAFSTALLDMAQALDATINNPRALVMQLTGHSARVLGADWAVLYQRDGDTPVFRATVSTQAPEAVAEEIRALDFSFASAPEFYRLLQQSETVELVVGKNGSGLARWLPRWHVSAALIQVVKRDQEIIGVLGCCYTARHQPFEARERQLLAAIAHQASVALENARLIEETRQANRLKSDFVATLSHELRTPVSIIAGYTELLLDDTPDPLNDEQRDMLERTLEQARQLDDLIQAMLDLNRLETRQLPLSITGFTIGELIADIRSNLPASWCSNDVPVEWSTRGEDTMLQSDRVKLKMILRNLIHNALKYTDVGRVVITAEPRASDSRVIFTVTDTGPGIAPEDQSAIFEMFRQANHATPRRGGVGLGLYIVKRLTEALGGQVSVESRQEAGAQFVVSLPLELPPSP